MSNLLLKPYLDKKFYSNIIDLSEEDYIKLNEDEKYKIYKEKYFEYYNEENTNYDKIMYHPDILFEDYQTIDHHINIMNRRRYKTLIFFTPISLGLFIPVVNNFLIKKIGIWTTSFLKFGFPLFILSGTLIHTNKSIENKLNNYDILNKYNN